MVALTVKLESFVTLILLDAESLEHLSSRTRSQNKHIMAALKAESFKTANLFQPSPLLLGEEE